MPPALSREIIEAAIEGYESQKLRIEEQLGELRRMLSGAPSSGGSGSQSPKRKFSAATLQKMRQAQRRRWAKVRGESGPAAAGKAKAKPQRKLSAAGRKAISEAARKRWAAKRAAS